MPVVVDVETGGFIAETDALLEVAACIIRMDDFGRLFVAETHDVNVEPFDGTRLDPKSLEITGIQVDNPLRGALPEAAQESSLSAKSFGGPSGSPHHATTTPNATTTHVYHKPE